jgi:hypothetical protein
MNFFSSEKYSPKNRVQGPTGGRRLCWKTYTYDMTRGFVLSAIVSGFILFGIFVAVYTIFDFGKRATSKEGRADITTNTKILVKDLKDPDLHKTMRDGFKWEIRFFVVLGAVLIIGAIFGTL